MSPRNPLNDENQPQEQIKGEKAVNLKTHKVVRFIEPDGSVREILQSSHDSRPDQEGRYVDIHVDHVVSDPGGNPLPKDPTNVVISNSGLFIGPDDQRAFCTSIFHSHSRSRNILVGQDGAITARGAICSYCQNWWTTIYFGLGILGLGLVYGLFKTAWFF
jgi:hypothetical protein